MSAERTSQSRIPNPGWKRPRLRWWVITIALAIVATAAWLAFRTPRSSEIPVEREVLLGLSKTASLDPIAVIHWFVEDRAGFDVAYRWKLSLKPDFSASDLLSSLGLSKSQPNHRIIAQFAEYHSDEGVAIDPERIVELWETSGVYPLAVGLVDESGQIFLYAAWM